jgi:hypothetical protein
VRNDLQEITGNFRLTVLRRVVVALSTVLLGLSASAQIQPSGSEVVGEHSGDRWISDPLDVLNFKVGFLEPSLLMNTTSGSNTDLTSVKFNPSSTSKLFVGFNYRHLGVTLSQSNQRTRSESEKFGAGDSTDVLFQFFGRTWTQQYFYQSYRGYYINNTATIDPSQPSGTYIQRPDLKTAHYGVNLLYNFQPGRFSPGAAFNQTGRQLESGGAWLAMLSLHNHKVSGDPQLLPTNVAGAYKELATIQQADLLQVGAAVGAGYTWVIWDGFYLSGQFMFGGGLVHQRFETADIIYTDNGTSTVSNVLFSTGYNGTNNYFVISAIVDGSNYPLPSMNLQLSSNQAVIAYGHRFNEVSLPWLDRWSAYLD